MSPFTFEKSSVSRKTRCKTLGHFSAFLGGKAKSLWKLPRPFFTISRYLLNRCYPNVFVVKFEQVLPILYILAQQASTCSKSILEILENTRDTKRCEIFSKLTIKTSEQRHWHHTFSSVSIVNFELVNVCWKVPTFPSIIRLL